MRVRARLCVQDGATCLYIACQQGNLDIAEFVTGLGGRELLMMADDVSIGGVADACGHIWRNRVCRTFWLA